MFHVELTKVNPLRYSREEAKWVRVTGPHNGISSDLSNLIVPLTSVVFSSAVVPRRAFA